MTQAPQDAPKTGLEVDSLVAGAHASGLGDEAIDQAVAVAGEEPDSGEDALLRVTVRKQVQGERIGVLAQAGLLR